MKMDKIKNLKMQIEGMSWFNVFSKFFFFFCQKFSNIFDHIFATFILPICCKSFVTVEFISRFIISIDHFINFNGMLCI